MIFIFFEAWCSSNKQDHPNPGDWGPRGDCFSLTSLYFPEYCPCEDQPKTWYTKIITLNICIYVFIYLFGCIRLAHIVAAYRPSCFIARRISAPQAGIKLSSPILQGRPPTTAHQGSPENHPLLTGPELHFWQIEDSMFCSSSCQKWSSTSQSSLLNLKIPPRGE